MFNRNMDRYITTLFNPNRNIEYYNQIEEAYDSVYEDPHNFLKFEKFTKSKIPQNLHESHSSGSKSVLRKQRKLKGNY